MDPPPMHQPPQPPVAPEAYPATMATAPFFSIANPAPSFPTVPNHPPYTEMITAAITALREKDGSSRKAIAKFIEGAYPNLPPAHPALLTHHLKRLKNSGQLVMVKKSYMLPPPPGSGSDFALPLPTVTAPPANFTDSPASKKRGRPSKPKPFPPEPQLAGGVSDPSAALGNGGVVSAKKRPGRPPKPKLPSTAPVVQQQQQEQLQQPVYAAEPISSNSAELGAAGLVNGSASLPKRRGRPPKYRAASVGEQVPGSSVKRRPGRPPKFGARPRGRPRKSAGLVAAIPAGGRARGRPPKRRMVVGDGGATPMGMKRRGRPPGSVSGARKLSVGRTGRPVGRPRKNASTVETQASEGRAREELTRKLEYMQLKVRNAVTLLKPHLINANIIDILTALQDLEELATMEITAPAITAPVTVPISEPTAPMMADMSAPPPAMPAPAVDVTAPPYAADPGFAAQMPVSYS